MKPQACSTFLHVALLAAAFIAPHAALAERPEAAFPNSSALLTAPAPATEFASAGELTPRNEKTTAAAALDLPDAPLPTDSPASAVSGEEGAYPVERETTWRSLLPDFGHDEKAIWTSPMQLAHGKAWVPTLITAGGTAGLIVADPHVMPWFRDRQTQLDGFNTAFNEWSTMGMIAAVPVGLMVTGTATHDQYAKTTALLAARGYANTEVLEFAAKLVARRLRPSDIPAGENFNHTFFKSKIVSGNGSSFPSGHSAGAFCVAYVVSERYRNHKWVPWTMYGLATVISMSRITTLGHFPSDVFLGGAMGLAVSKFEVMRPR